MTYYTITQSNDYGHTKNTPNMSNESQRQIEAFHLARIDALERMVKSLEMQVDDLEFELNVEKRMTFYQTENQKVTPAPLEAEASQKQAQSIIQNYLND